MGRRGMGKDVAEDVDNEVELQGLAGSYGTRSRTDERMGM